MRRLLAAALVALAAGCGGSDGPAELAVYDVEADLREAPGGPIRCEAPLGCRGNRYAVRGEPALTEADVRRSRAVGADIFLLLPTPSGARRLDRLVRRASRSGHHVALVLDGEVLAYAHVDEGVGVTDGIQFVTPRAKEIARRLD